MAATVNTAKDAVKTQRLADDDESQLELAHHFETPQQQFDAGKLGMWMFLATEVLFFGGLFVAYAIYRSSHPEVFVDASKHLNTTLGALNTVVLILSSLTMAWAVRCAQLGQRQGLVWLLSATLACAGFFLGVKAVEYGLKWDEGLLWAGSYNPQTVGSETTSTLLLLSIPAFVALGIAAVSLLIGRALRWSASLRLTSIAVLATAVAFLLGAAVGTGLSGDGHMHVADGHVNDHAEAMSPTSAGSLDGEGRLAIAAQADGANAAVSDTGRANGAGVFFSIYFSMTSLHALHIVIGMGTIVWLIWLAAAGSLGRRRFAPVDFVGLYWHLVDLVWIFLFPMLYLIE